jgi:hydrogenase small subunit
MGEKKRSWFEQEMARRGVSRRDFVKYCAGVATFLGLSRGEGIKMAAAVERSKKPILVWLEFQDCCGNTESLLRSSRPSVADLVLDTLSVDYHETIMAAAGHQAEAALDATVKNNPGGYLVVVEGSIPMGANGVYCTIGGKSALDIARAACSGAAATIAIGTCAAYGGLPAAAPNPTGAVGVSEAVHGLKNLINLPACPANAENLTALIVYYLTYKRWPPLDSQKRPLFAYGKSIHDACERRAHFDAGQYVEAWGDEAHRTGYCLYKMGCKGPVTSHNCPNVGWNEATNWPIGCGHPCIGCAEPAFWDKMTPFYRHLAGVPGFGVASDIDRIGLGGTAVLAAGLAAHGLVQIGRNARDRRLHPSPVAAGLVAPAAPGKDRNNEGGEP